MKKVAIIILSIIAFVACSKDEMLRHNAPAEIGFHTSAGNMVRAVYSNSTLEQFCVWGIYHNEEEGVTRYVFDGAEVNKQSDGSWSYGGKKYWPQNGVIDFLGVYPSKSAAQAILDLRTGEPVADISYTMSDEKREISLTAQRTSSQMNYAAQLPDVIYAVAEDQTKENSVDGSVTMRFRHATSQVRFEIKNENPMWTIKFRPDSAIVICNVRSKGVYTLPSATTSTDEAVYGTWAYEADDYADFTFFTGTNVYVEGMDETLNENGYIRPSAFMRNGEEAMILPCQNVAWDPSSGLSATDAAQTGSYFVIWCRVEVTTPSMNEGTEPFCIWGDVDAATTDESYYAPIYVPFAVDWQQHSRYKYTFAFGRGLAYNEDGTDAVVPLAFQTTVEEFIASAENLGVGN